MIEGSTTMIVSLLSLGNYFGDLDGWDLIVIVSQFVMIRNIFNSVVYDFWDLSDTEFIDIFSSFDWSILENFFSCVIGFWSGLVVDVVVSFAKGDSVSCGSNKGEGESFHCLCC